MLPPDCKTERQKDIEDVNKNMLKESIIDALSGLFKIFGDNTRIRNTVEHWIRWMRCALWRIERGADNMTNSALSHQSGLLKGRRSYKGKARGQVHLLFPLRRACKDDLKMALEHSQRERNEGLIGGSRA